ncbi:lysine N(6)-hydroxylase/L-ornithine N(5)-oxygenase family protein [Verminephrobacter eiseniae]|uniref:lysine N(6)-hydroxylase/L-ornithine N(5)-oxygenase family protein n=1 Tax=Verminephrobacter eiseniae TaxID=364317 RepID=UPI002237AAB3|nr:SidA/IucD/PvdA family monooxygenase [Verminephrobacter eiseniae]
MTNTIYDIIGIGFGPANIALAIALEELAPQLSVRFFERRARSVWQPGMLLDGSDIQNHPLRDLVTPRNPRSRYTFTNFLHEHNRLYEHLNLPLHYPLRLEYAQYVSWAANCFQRQVDYLREVIDISPVAAADGTLIHFRVSCSDGEYDARSVVLAPGRTPNIPEPFNRTVDTRVVHLDNYLPALQQMKARGGDRVAVVGGSQSAVEILLHACGESSLKRVVGITRNFGYRQKDTSPFSDEVYFPSFVDTFYSASPEHKERLRQELVHTNYSAADIDVLNQLYVRQYNNRLLGKDQLMLLTCMETEDCESSIDGVTLRLHHFLSGKTVDETVDLVILATGFLDLGVGPKREPWPHVLKTLSPLLGAEHRTIEIGLDYRIRLRGAANRGASLFLNGLCESSHGMGDAGSFSLLALRSQSIVRSLCQHLQEPVVGTACS